MDIYDILKTKNVEMKNDFMDLYVKKSSDILIFLKEKINYYNLIIKDDWIVIPFAYPLERNIRSK
jgi:hypothetical protein